MAEFLFLFIIMAIPVLPELLKSIEIPLRLFPTIDNGRAIYESKILDWLNNHRGEEISFSKDLCYIIEIGQIPECMTLTLKLIISFVNEFLSPNASTRADEQTISSLKSIIYIYSELESDISFLVYVNQTDPHTFGFDSWFDEHHLVICPCLFSDYIFYPHLKHSGVKLKHVYEFALTNFRLHQMNMDWTLFNKRIMDSPVAIHEANKDVSQILSGPASALAMITKKEQEQPEELFWKKNIYESKNIVITPPSSLSQYERAFMQVLSEPLGDASKQTKRGAEDQENVKNKRRRDD